MALHPALRDTGTKYARRGCPDLFGHYARQIRTATPVEVVLLVIMQLADWRRVLLLALFVACQSLLTQLKNPGAAHAAADAHGDQAVFHLPPFHFVEERGGEFCTGAA